MTDSFRVATYNVLAEAHIRPEWFPLVKPEHFVTAYRYPRITERIVGLDADIVCLQEVDDALFGRLKRRLEELDYRGWHTKYDGKPDGVATFLRWPLWRGFTANVIRYDDAAWNRGTPSGRLGHVVRLAVGNRLLSLANAHLKWNPPNTPRRKHLGYAQARMLLERLDAMGADARIVCGDMNVSPGHAVTRAFGKAGLRDAHPETVMTFNSSDAIGGPRKLDYVLHSESLVARGLPAPEVTDRTPLPSETEPSDHLPLVAEFRFAD